MKRQPTLSLIVSDSVGLATMAGAALLLGLMVNCLRSEPLPLFDFHPSRQDGGLPAVALPETTLATLRELTLHHEIRVIDARPAAFFALGHIPGAINLPLAELRSPGPDGEARLSWSKDDPLVVYCSDVSCSAARSEALVLERLGYRRVSLFPGGWYVWKRAQLPVETGP